MLALGVRYSRDAARRHFLIRLFHRGAELAAPATQSAVAKFDYGRSGSGPRQLPGRTTKHLHFMLQFAIELYVAAVCRGTDLAGT
jgi:hypothetical protein